MVCSFFASSSCAIHTPGVCLLAAAMWKEAAKEAANPIVKDSGVRRASPRGASQPEPAAAPVAPGASQPSLSHDATPAVGAWQEPRAAPDQGPKGNAQGHVQLSSSEERRKRIAEKERAYQESRMQRALELKATCPRTGGNARRSWNSRAPDHLCIVRGASSGNAKGHDCIRQSDSGAATS